MEMKPRTRTKTFQVGATYRYGHVTDHTWKTHVTVTQRTAKFVTLQHSDGREVRVGVKTDHDGEWVFPDGRYSMCPVLRAADVLEEVSDTVKTSGPDLNALEAQARELGRRAFHAGLPRTPVLDPVVQGLIEQHVPKVGSGAARIFRAWTAAWDEANLATPVPEKLSTGWIAGNGMVWQRSEPGVYTSVGYTLRKTHPTGRRSVRRWVLTGTAPNGDPVDVAIGEDLEESLEAASGYVATVQERWR